MATLIYLFIPTCWSYIVTDTPPTKAWGIYDLPLESDLELMIDPNNGVWQT